MSVSVHDVLDYSDVTDDRAVISIVGLMTVTSGMSIMTLLTVSFVLSIILLLQLP
jgi:hypothetical protein